MVEEGELLPDQDAVLAVDAGGLGERPAQLGRERARLHGVVGADSSTRIISSVEVARRAAKRRRGLVEQDVALALELHRA